MKIKTADLIGAPLDWAATKALGHTPRIHSDVTVVEYRQGIRRYYISIDTKFTDVGNEYHPAFRPSTSGSEVIDIMEREKINATYDGANWDAFTTEEGSLVTGPTLRIAVCRCFVASKLGDEVDVPEGLMK